MNALSWFLYFASVMSGVTGFLKFLTGFCVFVVLIYSVTAIISVIAWADDGQTNTEDRLFTQLRTSRLWKLALAGVFASQLMLVFIPSANTLYAIAASEVGSKVAQSEQIQGLTSDSFKALQSWIKRQISTRD